MTVQVDHDMERAFAQLYEVQKRLLSGALPPLVARRPLQDIIEGKFPEAGRFDTSSDHVQRVDDLEALYADFGSTQDNLDLYWKAISGTEPNAWRYDGLKSDKQHLRLGSNTRDYGAGIYRVRLNVVAHWEPEDGRTVIEVRSQAAQTGETLAHAETLAAYAYHDQLLQQQDGENLPYMDLAGYEACIPGYDPWRGLPCLGWSQFHREACLSAFWGGRRNYDFAVPVLRES